MENNKEKATMLCERFNIDFMVAMKALDESDGDIWGAVNRLEKEGVIHSASASYSTNINHNYYSQNNYNFNDNKQNDKPFKIGFDTSNSNESESNVLKELLKKILSNNFVVKKDGKKICYIPLIIFLIFLLVGNALTIVILIAALLMGYELELEKNQ